jgi:subtilisin-like proprotein convertase family protein
MAKAREMLRMTAWALTAVGCLGATGVATADEVDVIYGEDDRRDIFDPSNDPRLVTLARSTAVLVRRSQLTPEGEEKFQLPQESFGDNFNLCAEEPFREQPNPGFCSGFLVGEDVFVTAGHCVDVDGCATTAMVFDFNLSEANADPTLVSKDNVYYCQSIIAQAYDGGRTTDYAVIKLDRKVTDRTPLEFRKEGTVAANTNVAVIGHPSGLPTKISAGAIVRDATDPVYFTANLDTYGGNSGSAVFNIETGAVEGILVRGENDFVTGPGGCRMSNVCESGACRGEDVTKATEFAPFVPGEGENPDLPTQELVVEQRDLALAIPDNDPAGVATDLELEDASLIAGVTVQVKITHSYVGDLELYLVHPDGTEALLQRRQGGSQDGIDETFGEGFRAAPDLVRLKNKPANGAWKLKVVDVSNRDTGTLDAVTLKVKVYTNEEQPQP